jgi:hypothetical protein
MMLVRDFLDLPNNATPDEFIVRPESDAADLARKYTLTSAIRPRLDGLLHAIQNAVERNEDIGRFVFGSFGAGKSHFLRIAGMMLANDECLYDNARDDRLRELRNAHPWLQSAKILVVPVSMVGADAKVGSFTRSLATEFDRTLASLGKPTLGAFGTVAAFEAFDRRCSDTPALFAAFEQGSGYDRSFYDEMRRKAARGATALGDDENKEVVDFARSLGRFLTGNDHAFEPSEAEAREQMARHAHNLGYHAIAFTIDEFILWAQGLNFEGYAAAVNALNALVESADVKPVRFIALAAIQRSITTVFPEDRSDKPLREQISRVKDRFPEVHLEDSNIFEIAEKRVLAPLPERTAEWRTAIKEAAARFGGGETSVLVGDEPAAALEQLYPFHPALLRVLSDVSQGLHRARSSLYMLYQLVTEIRPNLQVGELISLGSLWDALFAEAHLTQLLTYGPKNEPTHAANRLLKTHATFERLRPAIDAAGKGNESDHVLLVSVVKSALLAQLSHTPFLDANRGLDSAITIENLFRLNRADIKSINDTSGIIKTERLLMALAQAEPGVVMLEGTGASARLRIELDAIDLTELFEILRPGPLFGTLLANVKVALNLTTVGGQEGRLAADLSHTQRNGHVRFESFEQFTASGKGNTLALEPGDEFKVGILIESEFGSNPQAAIDNARATLESTRDQSQAWAVAWLPSPLTQEARDALETLAKIELFENKKEDYLVRFRAGEHALVTQRMGTLKIQMQNALALGIARAYKTGRAITLRKDPGELVAPGNVDLTALPKYFATQLLERRYPRHPRFGASPGQSQLNTLVALDRRLAAEPTKNVISGDELDIVKKIGEPLDLFEPGSGVTNAKQGTYLDRIGECLAAGDRRVSTLLERLAREPFGLGRQVAQAAICVYIGRFGYRATLDGLPLRIETIGDLNANAELAKGDMPTVDQWNAAREAASLIFEVANVPTARTVGNADDLALKLGEPIRSLRAALDRCCDAFDRLRAKGAFAGESAPADRYGKARLEIAALVDRADLVVRIAELDVDSYSSVAKNAAVDGPELERLADFEHLATVIESDPQLKAKAQKALTADVSSVAPDIASWLMSARAWIADRLKAATHGVPPAGAPPVGAPPIAAPPPNGASTTTASTPAEWEATRPLPLDDIDFERLVTEFRTFLASAGSGASLTLRAHLSPRESDIS